MWDGFLPQTGQLTGSKRSRTVFHPWKPEIYLFQEWTASVPVCTTFRAECRKARPHGGCCSPGCGSPPCRQKVPSCPLCSPQKRRTDDKHWRKPQYLPSVLLKNYTRMKVKLRSPLGSASYANAGLFISDVSYILFSSMQSSNENDSVANFSRTQS